MKGYSFNDFVGYDYIKKDIANLVSILKNPQDYVKFNIDIPSGMILSGLPGVGKTLLAKVIASESRLPLYTIGADCSDSPAKTIREINKVFKKAIKRAPSIIVLDELENMLQTSNFVSDKTQAVLTALLTNLDGFKKDRKNVFVVATVNDYWNIPDTLRRSGRLEKHIHIDVPNQQTRELILKYYIDKTNLSIADDAIPRIARKMCDFTPSDIRRLVNTVCIQKVSEGKLNHHDTSKIITSVEDYLLPIMQIKADDVLEELNEVDKRIITYHELGHQVVTWVLRHRASDIVVGKFNDNGGANFEIVDDDESEYTSRNEIDKEACILLGGRAAEDLFTGDITDGSSSDVDKLRKIYGMCYADGLFNIADSFTATRRAGMMMRIDCSDSRIKKLEADYDKYLQTMYNKTKKILEDNAGLVEYLYGPLYDCGFLSEESVECLIKEYEAKKKD